jgi:sialate O-acetylesterase
MANNNQASSVLFNGMIAPLIPYAIKGALWYQGESSAALPQHYQAQLPALIADWRKKWGYGDFPFFIVQLPNFIQSGEQPIMPPDSPSVWAPMREAQKNIARSVSNADLAVTIDLAAIKVALHPWDKWDVAERLSLLARKKVYSEPNLVTHGPIYKSQSVEGNKVRITFEPDSIGGGLVLGNPPIHLYYAVEVARPSASPQDLTGFAIAGADNHFVEAKAFIDKDNTVVVSSEKVANPVSVRYDWADNPHGDLYNKEGLPAEPFRTDALPLGRK